MSYCTFFGHKDCNDSVKQNLFKAIEALITEHNVIGFFVGNQWNFDLFALKALRELQKKHPHIKYCVVLAYMPQAASDHLFPNETVYPEDLTRVPKRFAISHRNIWMINKSDYVISYVKRSYGGAAQFTEKAVKAGKTVINIAEVSK